MKFVGLVNNARDPLVCAVQKKSQQSRLEKKKKKKQTNKCRRRRGIVGSADAPPKRTHTLVGGLCFWLLMFTKRPKFDTAIAATEILQKTTYVLLFHVYVKGVKAT